MNKHHAGDRNMDEDTGFNLNVDQDLTPTTINLNESGVQELIERLGWNESTAREFVRYRERHGKFSSWTDLSNVPGIEASGIEEYRDRLEF